MCVCVICPLVILQTDFPGYLDSVFVACLLDPNKRRKCVCECMCLFSTLDVLKCNPFLAVHFFHCIVVELLFLPYIFAVLQSLQLIGVCVCVCVCISVCVYACVCEWMSWFCTLEVLEFHPVIVVYFFLHCGRFVD